MGTWPGVKGVLGFGDKDNFVDLDQTLQNLVSDQDTVQNRKQITKVSRHPLIRKWALLIYNDGRFHKSNKISATRN